MSVTKLHAGELGQLTKLAASGEDMAVLESFTAKRASVEEDLAAGRALREKVPRADHARYQPSPHREDPLAILERQTRDARAEAGAGALRPHAAPRPSPSCAARRR